MLRVLPNGFAKVLLFWLLLFLQNFIFGQSLIKGTVTDADTGDPLIGANIVSKESPNSGTISDFDGSFSFTPPIGTKTLIFSYAGYTSREIEITNQTTTLNVELAAGQILEDVIVIGYGTVKRDDATGSLQSVSSSSFNRGAITSPQELLSGKVAGVAITTGGGPDDGAQIRIRGLSSLSASNDPLIVIDGIPLENAGVSGNRNFLNVINPNDIESMTVLKDASATAIYGSRASAGVILITTKKGTVNQKLSVGYIGNVSVGKAFNKVDVLNASEYRDLITSYYGPDHISQTLLGNSNTDWQDLIYREAFGQDHNVNITGGVGNFPIRASVGYTSKEGLLRTDKFDRYSLGLNVSPKFLNNRLQFNLGVKSVLSKNRFAERGVIGSALSWDPTQTPYDSTSVYSGYTTWTQPNGNPNGLAPANPIAVLEQRNDRSEVKRYILNGSIDYRFAFLPALRANLNLGYDYSDGQGTIMVPGNNVAAFSFEQNYGGGINNTYNQQKKNSIIEFYLNYKKSYGKHTLDLLGGYSWQRFFTNNSYRNSDAANTPVQTVERNNIGDELLLLSFFGRANYDYNSKYFLTFSLRNDGTSRFSPDSRWGLFPAAAFAIKLFDNNNHTLNSLKLRTGWGVTGQQAIGSSYVYRNVYTLGLSNAQYQFGDQFYLTYRPDGYDAKIKWEETTTYNIGFDISVIKDRLSVTIDGYKRYTKDLLNRVSVAAGTNLTNFIDTNVGNMENQGVEVSLNLSPFASKDFTWDLGVNGAYNTNKITKLTATDDPAFVGNATGSIAGGVGSNIQINTVGYAPSSFYVYKQKYDEAGIPIENQFEDLNNDNIINENDKYRYKKPAPDFIFGITSNLRFKNLDFSFAGRANLGNYVYNNVQTDMGYYQRLYQSTNYLQNINRSAVTNDIVNQSSVTFSDHFVTDASFFRIDHITLGYTFHKLVGNGLRLYTTVQNPFIITNYGGLDPEIGNGIDGNIYPRPRTYLFGVSVNF